VTVEQFLYGEHPIASSTFRAKSQIWLELRVRNLSRETGSLSKDCDILGPRHLSFA
jgi:hypothetical protein